jgi:hypothetical protein
MNLQERLNNISNARVLRDDLEIKARVAEYHRRDEYQAYFDKYLKRIDDLIMTAKHLQANGFLLGKRVGRNNSPEFVSEGISHQFGFVCDGNPFCDPYNLKVIGVGYKAGGADGETNTIINESGFISMNECYYKTKKKEKVEADLLDFEKRFYKFVDTL